MRKNKLFYFLTESRRLAIIAVAGNYDEALLLACDIVKETYENTGKTDVKSYLKSRRRK